MFVKQLILSVGAALIVASDVRANSATLVKELERQIDEVTEQVKKSVNENVEIAIKIESFTEEYQRKMKEFDVEHKNITADTKKFMEELKKLLVELSTLYKKEDELTKKLKSLSAKLEKLKLAAKWLNEDLFVYHRRQNVSDDVKCYQVENVTVENIVHKQADTRTDDDMVIYLTNVLAQMKTELLEVKQKNAELRLSLNNSVSFWTHQLNDLEELAESSIKDWDNAKTNLANLTEKKARVTEEITKLEVNIAKTIDEIARIMGELRNIKSSLASLVKATSCYASVEKDALKHAGGSADQ